MNLCGPCPVCGLTIPGTQPAPPYDDLVQLDVHSHPDPRFTRCIGSRVLADPVQGDVQLHLYGEEREAA